MSTMSGNGNIKNGTNGLSLVAQFDDIVRCYDVLSEGCEQEFKRFVLGQEAVRLKWLEAVNECQRMKGVLDSSNSEITKLNQKLRTARTMLDRERAMRKSAEEDLAAIIRDYNAMDNSVTNATLRSRFSGDARILDRLNTISERDSDVRSELSYSRSDDDLDVSYSNMGKHWRKNRPSTVINPTPVSAKRRRSSLTTNTKRTIELNSESNGTDRVVTTTTVTAKKDGQILASSSIETVPTNSRIFAQPMPPSSVNIQASAPPESDVESDSVDMNFWKNENLQNISPNFGTYSAGYKKLNSRMHQFISKTVIKPEVCGPCGRRISFGKVALKCMDCRAVAHYDCKDKVPLPCVAMGSTPTAKGAAKGTIADYTPLVPPMVPALVIHCINEIEQRGFSEIGLYRVPGSDKDVKALKEKFMRGRGAPNLSQVSDIHVVCGCLKDFLRNLSEPLILQSMWSDFVRATEVENKTNRQDLDDSRATLYQAIASLPQPNRDTLAYIILHLQRVADVPECKMPAKSLATVFGPTIVGPKNLTQETAAACKEFQQAANVVELLLSIPSDYWATFISGSGVPTAVTPSITSLRNTPSTENLMRQTVNRLFSNTPLRQRTLARKRFFDTPPSHKK